MGVNLIQNCREMLKRDWEVSTNHIFREQNKVTDVLAKSAASNDRLVRIFKIPLEFLELIIERDKLGCMSGRLLKNIV